MAALAPTLVTATPHAEQAWNARQLAEPVTEPRLRLWTYRAPGVVFGCSQRALHQRTALADRAVVRGSGGGAVLTGPWMLSASIVLPPDHALLSSGPIGSYRWLGVLHAGLLRDMGIAAFALPPEQARSYRADAALTWACYGGLSPWEVVVESRKIVGLAQLRRRTGVLLTSGTLIAPPDWRLLCEALGQPAGLGDALAHRTTSCETELGAPVIAEVLADRLHHMLTDVLGSVAANDHDAMPRACVRHVPPLRGAAAPPG